MELTAVSRYAFSWMRSFLFGALVFGVGACSLFVNLDESSPPVPSNPEAGTVEDARTSTPDVAAQPDAADGSANGDGKCTPKAGEFCEDFDNPLGAACSLMATPSSATSITPGDAVSPPNFLRINLVPIDGRAGAQCRVSNGVLPTTAKNYRLSLRLRFPTQGAVPVEVARVFPNAAATDDAAVSLISAGASISTSAFFKRTDGNVTSAGLTLSNLEGPLLPLAGWHMVELEISHSARTVTLSIDGVKRTPMLLPADVVMSEFADPRIDFGTAYVGGLPASVSYDLDSLAIVPLP